MQSFTRERFRFDPDLKFQNQAIAAAVRLFEGAPRQETGFALISENGVVGNRLLLNDDALLTNLQQVQTDPDLHNGTPIPISPEMGSHDFSVEMETGTGKTYVYLRTALELYETYGFRKFIVVVLKTLRITRDHLAGLYDNLPYRFYQYDSSVERDFAEALEAMDEVKLFVKLPDWFIAPTPIGDYNPD